MWTFLLDSHRQPFGAEQVVNRLLIVFFKEPNVADSIKYRLWNQNIHPKATKMLHWALSSRVIILCVIVTTHIVIFNSM